MHFSSPVHKGDGLIILIKIKFKVSKKFIRLFVKLSTCDVDFLKSIRIKFFLQCFYIKLFTNHSYIIAGFVNWNKDKVWLKFLQIVLILWFTKNIIIFESFNFIQSNTNSLTEFHFSWSQLLCWNMVFIGDISYISINK